MRFGTAKVLVAVLALAATISLAPPALADTYLVRDNGSGDFPTIQAALDAVSSGDVIELASGTFDGAGNRDLDFLGKAVTIRSQSGDPADVTIDCDGSQFSPHRAFWFHSGEGASSLIQGISIVNGFIQDGNGGAVLCESASPTFDGCVFGSNTVDGTGAAGGAIYCTGASTPTITACRFIGNAAGEYSDGVGGALAFTDGADATVTDTVVDGNFCGAEGGGIYASACDLTLTDCSIVDNGGGSGAGVKTQNGTFTFTGTSFLWNEATGTGYGGGLSAPSGAYDISGCTFMGNLAVLHGGGIFFGIGTGSISNSIVAYSLMGGGIYVDANRAGPSVTCCDVYENTGGDYVGMPDQTGVNNNISEDPLFCDAPSGDVSIYNTSPCAADQSPCGVLIGSSDVGCYTAVEPTSWGRVKATFE